ncbi:MAG: trimethylamine methyltransferase family protein [Ruminococcus sp.]|nr:trimethylamine methyltransferase family protein [Ruminococcus sp.]
MDMTDRFIKVYSQGKLTTPMEIWVDRKTGVNYIYHSAGYSGGLTVLVDKNGKPIVTDPNKY